MYCVLYFTLEKKNISYWPKSGPVETGPTGPVATPLQWPIPVALRLKTKTKTRMQWF